MIEIAPYGDHVLVRRELDEPGILTLPDAYRKRERPARGTVLAVGDGRRDGDGRYVNPAVSPGDRVVFLRHAGDGFRPGADRGEELLMMREDDILAVIEDPSCV